MGEAANCGGFRSAPFSYFYFEDGAVYNIIEQPVQYGIFNDEGSTSMKIALAQMNPTVGDLTGNVLKITKMIAEARNGGADLVIFPEMAVVGYPPHDLILYRQFVSRAGEMIRNAILPHADGIDLLLGTPWGDPGGAGLFNSALLLREGRIATVHHQSAQADDNVFAAEHCMARADTLCLAEFQGRKMAVAVGGDVGRVWRPGVAEQHITGSHMAKVLEQGADLLVNIASSPYFPGVSASRDGLISALARKYNTGVIWVNQVGGNDELVFDGRSMACTPGGKIVFRAPPFEEGVFIFDCSTTTDGPGVPGSPEDIGEIYAALGLGLGDYLAKGGFEKVVLGLSGGIDSAVVAALAADTLGPEKVLGVMMPSRYSSEHSIEDSETLGRNLGIQTRLISIESVFSILLELLGGDDLLMDLAEENLQARIRGIILMFISNRERYFVLPTGNKSEISVGYSTLYGDMCGGLLTLADLSKGMVYRLAGYINQQAGREVIPRSIIMKPPSAELRPGQKDRDSLPPYDVLDELVHRYVEKNSSPREIIAAGYDPATVREVAGKIDGAEFKRFQSPPCLRVINPGSCRRMPLVGKGQWF
jgi:NAD+ synthase (glutamine-hydrolysing)